MVGEHRDKAESTRSRAVHTQRDKKDLLEEQVNRPDRKD